MRIDLGNARYLSLTPYGRQTGSNPGTLPHGRATSGLPVIRVQSRKGEDRLRTSSLPRVADRLADSLTILKRLACNGELPAAAFKQQLTYPPLRLKSSEKETNHHGQNASSGFR